MTLNSAVKEDQLVLTVVRTVDTFGRLRYVVCSLTANSRSVRHDLDWICLVAPDIKAVAPLLREFTALLVDNATVTSGKEVWNDDNVVPVRHPGVGGRHFFTAEGFVFDSPYLALYRRDVLDETCARLEVGLGSPGPELDDAATEALWNLDHHYRVYDTAKVVNALLQADGHAVTHVEHDHLVHVEGLSHWISPPETVGRSLDLDRDPEWIRHPKMSSLHGVARFTARVLPALDTGSTASALPDGLDPATLDKLSRVRAEVTDIVESHRWC
jgi:hypothetical protein